MTKIWVDDERPVPNESWTLAVSVEDAKEKIGAVPEGDLEWVSLDYSLGWGSWDDNGGEVLKWMIAEGHIPSKLTAHSGSWSGRELVIEIAKSAGIVATVFEGDNND